MPQHGRQSSETEIIGFLPYWSLSAEAGTIDTELVDTAVGAYWDVRRSQAERSQAQEGVLNPGLRAEVTGGPGVGGIGARVGPAEDGDVAHQRNAALGVEPRVDPSDDALSAA